MSVEECNYQLEQLKVYIKFIEMFVLIYVALFF